MLEPPVGGWERLKRELRQHSQQARWHSVMPWVATACLLLLIATPLVVEPIRALHDSQETVKVIVETTRAQDPRPLVALTPRRADVQVYLAVPVSAVVEE